MAVTGDETESAATGDIPAYQLRSPNSGLAQSIVMAASPSSMQSPSSHHAEEITRKREVRLMKNSDVNTALAVAVVHGVKPANESQSKKRNRKRRRRCFLKTHRSTTAIIKAP